MRNSSSAARCGSTAPRARDRDAHRRPLGLDLVRAAWGIHQLVNENMASAARIHAVERGKDIEKFPLFAFGGAGPVHAYRIARSCAAARGLPARRRRDVGDRVPLRPARLRLRAQPAGPARGDGLGCGQRRARRDGERAGRRVLRRTVAAIRSRFAASATSATGARGTRSGCRCPAVCSARTARARSAARSSRRTARSTGTSCPSSRSTWSAGAWSPRAPSGAARAHGRDAGPRERAQGPARRVHAGARGLRRRPGVRPLPPRAGRRVRRAGDRRGARSTVARTGPAPGSTTR